MLFIMALLAAGQQRVAVLEFDAAKAGSDIDRTYFSDLVRGAVHKAAPQLFVMTRESTVQLLKASGKKLEDCAGECEVETGKLLGADFVVSGRITRVGTRYSLTLRLHSTESGELLNTAEARGKSIDELVDAAGSAAEEVVRSLTGASPSKEAAVPAESRPAPALKSAPTVAASRSGRQAAGEDEAKRLLVEGNRKLIAQELDGAIALYQKALSLQPSDEIKASLYRNLGVAYTRHGDLDEGARYYSLYLPLCTDPAEKAYIQKTLDDYKARRAQH